MVCAAVAAEARVVKKFVVPANCKLPLLRMTNLVAPDLEAVNKSPVPVLSAKSPAKEVEPDAEAMAIVPPLVRFGRISSVAKGVVVPIPTLPELIIKLAAGGIVKFPELLEMVELPVPPIDKVEVGAVVPIPTLPLFPRNNTEVRSASPPGLRWKFRVPLFKRLKVAA